MYLLIMEIWYFIVECLKMSYIIIVKNEKLDLRFKILVYLNIIV